MLALLIFAIIAGAVVAGVTGIGILFWVVAIALFVCGLPAALVTGFIHGEVKYAQDRADYREEMRQLNEEERELMRELEREERYERYLDRMDRIESKRNRVSYNIDARSVHYHDHSKPRARDEKGRFIANK